jgi:hypothetical protein
MENETDILKIKELSQHLLTCADDFLIMKQSVDQLYSIFSRITDITCDDLNDEQIFLSSGKAISPSSAAFCLLEMKRTAIFLRGINKAIQQKLSENSKRPVQILYAGTGPYATLLLPLLTLYSPVDIQADLLDINEISLNAVKKIIGELGLDPFINKSYLNDAAIFIVETDYDIVISETMQAALKKEPQVAIMQNLIPQMPDKAIFIPSAITITAKLVSAGYWNTENIIHPSDEVLIAEDLFTVDKLHLDAAGYHNELDLSGAVGKYNRLILDTTISVFENEVLKNGDCSLTLPLTVSILDKDQTGGINFWYEQGEIPGIRCQLTGSEQIIEAIGKRDRQKQLLL